MSALQDALALAEKERADSAENRREMAEKYNALATQHANLGEKVDKLEESISQLVKVWESANLGLDIIKWLAGVIITSSALWIIFKPYIGLK